ncbi:DUF445 domain-containing protein [Hydromonas duriensis]|uniref:Uncharacterized membrane-anchored protein YjiN (DUF445 family) n=1 Tax=Hydromonas duriensis TaxID=1527608 RepID=A0A4R6Y8H4_9BURK|nr:DUF445 domain-containing protein [Hydromonas duriensis]TDR31671.1 uncharacterized membrane-anchored protein YjiN (DUF445 family) [Hydromonas duriensis]
MSRSIRAIHKAHTARRWALILLLVNLTVFISVLLAQSNGYHHPALAYIKAFAEAACIGGLADWFAVVALFRHPLGIPLPHTAILPAKQAQLAQGVAKFITTHFLEPSVISEQLLRLDVGRHLNVYAQQHLTQAVVVQYVPNILQTLMRRVPIEAPTQLVVWSRSAMTAYLSGARLGRSTARLIDVAREQGLDRRLVNAMAQSLHEFVTAEDAKERMRPWLSELAVAAQKLDTSDASWWDKMKSQLTGQAIEWADDLIIDKSLAWLADLTVNVQQDEQHPVHLWVGEHVQGWREKLYNDEVWHDWLAAHVHDWLHTTTAEAMVKAVWSKSRSWLDEAVAVDSAYIEPVAEKIRQVVLTYIADSEQQSRLTEQLAQQVAKGLTEYQDDIREWLTTQMNMWSKERLNSALDNAIGHDLQYIRINGTLIGGLIGVILFAISQWLG